MLPVLRVQHPGTEWERNHEPAPGPDGELRGQYLEPDLQRRFPYGGESGAFPYKSGGVGVYTGGSVNPKRDFALIERLFVIASVGCLRYHIAEIRRHCACVFMNSTVKGS